VRYIGIDLAWGTRRPTGLAVLDEAGHLLHLSTAGGDEEIVATLTPYAAGDCLVALDAPLVVTNATGARACEAALNADFARFHAGAHPSNTGKPEFSQGTRGARICAALGLDVNPRSGRARRGIEVYPHPATIALFGLPRTLKYKDKPGRTFAERQAALLRLMTLLESRASADPPLHLSQSPAWRNLRAGVEGARRKSELRVAEDQVDAVLCAYIALFADRHPDRTITYGDLETGYIVTPALREPTAADTYAATKPGLDDAGRAFVALVTEVLDEAGINYLSVTGRTKSVESFAEKAARTRDGLPLYADPLRDITDQIGVRVITYVNSDVSTVVELLADQMVVLDDRDMGLETASEGRFGYASRHLLIALGPDRAGDPAYAPMRDRTAQVQIRTVLQHAWAEFEHDIRYKGSVPEEHARDFDRRFTLAAGLLELADREFATIRERLRTGPTDAAEVDDGGPQVTPRELAAFLAGQYADAEWSRTDHYVWIAGLLPDLGITSIDRLGEVLRGLDGADLMARMDYRYPPGAVRRLDDALLAAYGDTYVDLPGNAHRADALRQRLKRLVG
jgi:predicted RNase H-like nuclease/ppGpp synthetase/RelA/SpoT-type nucleotidyltranferase